mgnify:CR=1 FL=1
MAGDDISIERFKIMQSKLFRGIANPSMLATLGLGGWLVAMAPEYYLKQTWFHAKMAFVLLVIGYHFACSVHLQSFANDNNQKSHRYFRIFNEVPVLFLTAIVILVIVRPF